jgi:RHS repeat-associated protein
MHRPLALFALLVPRLATAVAGDPFAAALPASDTQPPEGVTFAGEGSVDETQGSATYRLSIRLPAGRNAMAPELALTYSSGGALRGDIAVGWSLDLPSIERDPVTPYYRLSLGGRSQLLVPAPADPGPGSRYRMEVDEGFARVERSGSSWKVYTPDGVVHTFAGTSSASDATTRWNLTSQRDRFGNEVIYGWSRVLTSDGYVDHQLSWIEYTSNAAAGLAAHARVELSWANGERCGVGTLPVGARGDHHFGVKRMYGAGRLLDVVARVRDLPGDAWREARRVTLSYDAEELSCSGSTPQLRYLTQVDERAGTTSAPPIRFTYGPTRRDPSRATYSSAWLDRGTDMGPTTSIMDIDADGINDSVRVELPRPGEQRCKLVWQRGISGGAFEMLERTVELPTAAWKNPDAGPSELESCTLNGQMAQRPWQLRPSGNQTHCVRQALVQVSYRFVDWDGDGDPDLLANVKTAGADPRVGGDFLPPLEPTTDQDPNPGDTGCYGDMEPDGGSYEGSPTCRCTSGNTFDLNTGECRQECNAAEAYDYETGECHLTGCDPLSGCPSGGDGGGGLEPLPSDICPFGPLSDEPGLAVRVIRNVGGTFALSEMTTHHLPAPLPASGGELGRPATGVPPFPRLVDLDGDGWLDMVETSEDYRGSAHLKFYRNDGNGGFASEWTVWPKPVWGGGDTIEGELGRYSVSSTLEVTDMNGDGLPDVVFGGSGGTIAVSYNMGASFGPVRQLGVTGPLESARLQMPSSWTPSSRLTTGWRSLERRLLDVDADGLPEVLAMPGGADITTIATTRTIYGLHGDAFAVSYTLPSTWEPLERLVRATSGKSWYRASDFVDVTGDGLPDLVTRGGTLLNVRTEAAGAGPLRLLTQVDNGRGALLRYEYQRSTAVVATDGRHEPRWLVTRVVTSPGAGQPDLTLAYRYEVPMWSAPTQLAPVPQRLLGYARVTTESSGQQGPAARRTTRVYSFFNGRDRRPHLTHEQVEHRVGEAWTTERTVEHAYENLPVLDGLVTATLPTRTIARVGGAVKVARQVWTPFRAGAGGPPLGYYLRHELEGLGEDGSADARRWSHLKQVRHGQAPYAADDYRLLTTEERLEAGTTLLSLRTLELDTASGLPLREKVYVSAFPVEVAAVTERTFHTPTGNLLSVKRPRQVAAGGTLVTRYSYDAHQLHVASTVNELGHTVTETRDVATGALVRREGPNRRTYPVPGCPLWNCTITASEPEEWTIDGFGRVTEHRVAVDTTAHGGYALAAVEWTAHDDLSRPNRVTTRRLRDWGGTATVDTVTEYDGLGRVVATIEKRQVAGTPDAVSTFAYDAGGELASASRPDPRVDDSAKVTYRYVRDGLGRVTRFERPDGSAVAITHEGLATVSREEAPGEIGGSTRRILDGHGRLVEVHEETPAGKATTLYRHDGADRVIEVRDADGTITTFTHDLRGLRTSATRGGRVWSYVRDLDGNIVEERTPRPAGALESEYVSKTTYDAIGRAVTHTPAPRGLSAQRRAQLGIGTLTTTYDSGPNAVGQAVRVAIEPTWRTELSYDVRRKLAREQRTLTFAHIAHFGLTQWVTRTYNALGAPVDETWDDGTSTRTTYDARGLPLAVALREGTGYRTLAAVTRSIAGAPRQRTGAADQRRDLSYDVLGRVVYDRVSRASTGATFAERSYGHDGLGRLRLVDGHVNGAVADATFEYDARDRVIDAVGPAGYRGSFVYSGSGNVLRATVSGALDSPARDVMYRYGARDPQAVDALDHAFTGARVAALTYDAPGNLVRREAGTVWDLTWDGDDRLREVTGPGGTETYHFGLGPDRVAAIGPDAVKVWFGSSETHLTLAGVEIRRWHHVALGEPVARVERAAKVTTHELQYADGQQNLMLALTPDGAVTGALLYGAFGELAYASGAEAHRRQFNGKESDALSGLRFYGHRSYDPLLLRWTSADPKYRFAPDAAWDEPQRANLYAFSLNNPLQMLDPDGLDAEVEPGSKGRIYVLHGVGSEDRDSEAARDALAPLELAEAAGYEVVRIEHARKAHFLHALKDSRTVGIIVDEHGSGGGIAFKGGVSKVRGGEIFHYQDWMDASDLEGVEISDGVEFVVFNVCGFNMNEGEWRDRLGARVYTSGADPDAAGESANYWDRTIARFGLLRLALDSIGAVKMSRREKEHYRMEMIRAFFD